MPRNARRPRKRTDDHPLLDVLAEQGLLGNVPEKWHPMLEGWRFRWNTRGWRFLGRTHPGLCVIEVRAALRPFAEELADVLLHEVAHALHVERWVEDGRAERVPHPTAGMGLAINWPHNFEGHGLEWRYLAVKIGARPESCAERSQMPKQVIEALDAGKRVVAQCTRCGQELRRQRALPKRNLYTHRGCGGVYEPTGKKPRKVAR